MEEHAHFLRDVAHSTQIRSQLIENWNRANIPGDLALTEQWCLLLRAR